MVDYYQILGVKSTASVNEINAAYKRLARKRHPDLNGGSPEAALEFVEITKARDLLIDPKRRAAYDAQRNAYAAKGAYAPIVNPTVETYVRRARSDARIKQNIENFLVIEREEIRALQQTIYPIVAFLFASFFVPLVRPHFWHSSGSKGRTVLLVLFVIGVWYTVSKISAAIKFHTEDQSAAPDDQTPRSFTKRQAYLYIGLAAVGCALLGTLIGTSLTNSLLSAMPMFFHSTLQWELLFYPWIVVLVIGTVHSLSQKIDI